MVEIRKFKEARPQDTSSQKLKENQDKIKKGNETGVGTDFTQKYSEVLDRIQKEKFPTYIDPSTLDIINNPDLMDKFQEMSQMKESLLKAVDEELKNPSSVNVKPSVKEKPVFKPFSVEELKTASTKQILERGYSIFSPEYLKTLKKEVAEEESRLKNLKKETPTEEVLNNVPEKPIFTQEDQLLSEKLEKEIYDLKEEILNLERQRVELESIPAPQIAAQDEIINEKEEDAPASATESKEIITEHIEIEDYRKAIDKIVINKLGDAFEKNGLDYENTLVEYENGKVHTEIKFNYGKVVLAFDLVSQGDRAILTNDDWRQSGWNKFITLNKLNKKNAEQWCNIIAREFAKTKSKDNKPMKIDVKDGMLEIQHQI